MAPDAKSTFFAAILVASALAAPLLPSIARAGDPGRGMVAAAHPAASEAGVEMLRAGGNAVDAAVAAALVAGVVEPYSAGIGGGGFMVIWLPEEQRSVVIDYREKAPAAAHRDMFLDQDGNVAEGRSLRGHLAVGVPGTVAGLALAVEKYGALPFSAALAPAIRHAEDGFAAHRSYTEKLPYTTDMLASFSDTSAIFLTEDGVVEDNELIVQRDLAATLRTIAAEGPGSFYSGAIAQAIAADMAAAGGLITLADLAGYAPTMREPLVGSYRGYTVHTMPPPSSGGVCLLAMLNMLEHSDLRTMGRGNVSTVHVMAEAMKRAYADRAEHLGDPAFVTMPINELISKETAARRRETIYMDRATPSAQVRPLVPGRRESPSTTHVSAVDGRGMAVSMTQSINYSFGSGVTVPGTGILLNNTMDDFSAKPGVPNVYGLVGNEANAIAPGKIPLSSMTPTILTRDGAVFMVIGSPGGSTIINTVLQSVINVVDHEMAISSAINARKIHHQWLPDELRVEAGALTPKARASLESLGHAVVEKGDFGNAMGIVVDAESGALEGAADRRGVGSAAGY